jgi:hypothetical protein
LKAGVGSRETIRELSGQALTRVIGGLETDTADGYPFSGPKQCLIADAYPQTGPKQCLTVAAYPQTRERQCLG